MIVKDTVGPLVETSAELQELSFGVRNEDMGLILEILRSKMYKNAIGSICREVASNSRDANREAENLDPIVISIVDSPFAASDCAIAFKDEGIGISPERMANVFVNYGASTKRSSNELTGGYGVGAKTPFSYVDNFTIETVFDKIKYTYVAAIEEQKKGKIYLLSKEDVDQRNATTIIVPIKNDDDREKFEKETLRATAFWTVPPRYVNFRSEFSYKVLHEHDKCAIVSLDQYNSMLYDATYALVDGILYDIDSNSIGIRLDPGSEIILLKFDIGEVSVSANREALRYDEQTIKKITSRYTKFVSYLESRLREEIEKAPSYLEACIRYYALREDRGQDTSCPHFYDIVARNRNHQMEYKWGDKEVRHQLELRQSHFRLMDSSGYSNQKTVWDKSFLECPIFLLDRQVSALKNRTLLQGGKSFLLLELDDKDFLKWKELPYSKKKQRIGRAKSLRKDFEYLESVGVKFSKYSEVPNTRIPRQKREKSTAAIGFVTLPVRVLSHGSFVADSLRVSTKEMYLLSVGKKVGKQPEFIYCVLDSLSDYEGYIRTVDVQDRIAWAQVVEFLTKKRVVFVNKKNVGHVRKLKALDEVARAVPRKKLIQISSYEFVEKQSYDLNLGYNYGTEFQKEITRLQHYRATDFKKKKVTKKHFSGRLPQNFEKMFPAKMSVLEMDRMLRSIYSRYPLLSHLSNRYLGDKDVAEVNRYIRLIDSERKENFDKKKKIKGGKS